MPYAGHLYLLHVHFKRDTPNVQCYDDDDDDDDNNDDDGDGEDDD